MERKIWWRTGIRYKILIPSDWMSEAYSKQQVKNYIIYLPRQRFRLSGKHEARRFSILIIRWLQMSQLIGNNEDCDEKFTAGTLKAALCILVFIIYIPSLQQWVEIFRQNFRENSMNGFEVVSSWRTFAANFKRGIHSAGISFLLQSSSGMWINSVLWFIPRNQHR